jgi:AcrR family transcriptional regulator
MVPPPNAGLRERKKAQTRAVIAETAARLFADAGFPAVTMIEIASAAGVSEQTVYNHFPTKESLVFDRVDELRQTLLEQVADRAAGTDLLDAYTHWLDTSVLGEPARRSLRHAGGMPRLVAADGALRRHLLDHADRLATTLAERLTDRERIDPVVARTVTDAMLSVFVRAVDDLGAIRRESQLAALRTDVHRALDTLRPALTALRLSPAAAG